MDETNEIAPGIVATDGKPFLSGCHVEVETILRDLAEGLSPKEVEKRRGVGEAGQRAALNYAFEIMEDEVDLVQARVLSGGDAVEPAPGISASSRIRLGKPVLTGTRINVQVILGHLAAGDSVEELAEAYGLSQTAIRDTIGYAAKIVSLETVTAR